jgi:hypothetical protein
LVRDTQSARFNALTRGSYQLDRERAQGTSQASQERRYDEADASAALVQPPAGDEFARRPTSGVRPRETGQQRTLAEQLAVEQFLRDERERSDNEELDLAVEAGCSRIFEQEPDLLPVLIESAISVGGAVRRPGAYPVGGPVSARQAAAIADGLIATAVTSGWTSTVPLGGGSETISADGASGALDLASLLLGDDIRFNAALPAPRGASGAAHRRIRPPGGYAVRKDETLGPASSLAPAVVTPLA